MKTMINKQLRNQRAMEYIIYMMVGSYFKSAKCNSKVLERRLLLHYREMGDKLQIERELKCINYVEGYLMKRVPERIWSEDVVVTMAPDAETGKMIVSFKGRNFTLSISYDSIEEKRFEHSLEIIKKLEHAA